MLARASAQRAVEDQRDTLGPPGCHISRRERVDEAPCRGLAPVAHEVGLHVVGPGPPNRQTCARARSVKRQAWPRARPPPGARRAGGTQHAVEGGCPGGQPSTPAAGARGVPGPTPEWASSGAACPTPGPKLPTGRRAPHAPPHRTQEPTTAGSHRVRSTALKNRMACWH